MDANLCRLALNASKCSALLFELREILATRTVCKENSVLTYIYKIGNENDYSDYEVHDAMFDEYWWKHGKRSCNTHVNGSRSAQYFVALLEQLEPVLHELASDPMYDLLRNLSMNYLHSIPCNEQSLLAEAVRKHVPTLLDEDFSEDGETYTLLVEAILWAAS